MPPANETPPPPPQGYGNSDVAAKCGTMLRDALRNERVGARFFVR